MKRFSTLLWAQTAFSAGVACIYVARTGEPTGTVLLISAAIMPAICAVWLTRHPVKAEDPSNDLNATHEAHAQEPVGSFPAVTVWPIIFVLGLVVTGASLIYGLLLLPPGLSLVALAAIGLMRESQH